MYTFKPYMPIATLTAIIYYLCSAMLANAATLHKPHLDTTAEGGKCTWHFVHNQIEKSNTAQGEITTSFDTGMQNPANPVASSKQTRKTRHYKVTTVSEGEITLINAVDNIDIGKLLLSDFSCMPLDAKCPCDFSNEAVNTLAQPIADVNLWPVPFDNAPWAISTTAPTSFCEGEIGTVTSQITFQAVTPPFVQDTIFEVSSPHGEAMLCAKDVMGQDDVMTRSERDETVISSEDEFNACIQDLLARCPQPEHK